MRRITLLVFALCASSISSAAMADALTQIIQRDLVTLGYDPGNTDGEATVATAVAISKFQAEHDLDVTGEASPQLAGIIKSQLNGNSPAGGTAQAAAGAVTPAAAQGTAQPAGEALALQAAQQACLQQKMAEAEASQQRRRGIGRLARAIGRATGRLGSDEISSDIARLSSDVYTAGAIASDFKGAAEDLGLTESDLEACRNPS